MILKSNIPLLFLQSLDMWSAMTRSWYTVPLLMVGSEPADVFLYRDGECCMRLSELCWKFQLVRLLATLFCLVWNVTPLTSFPSPPLALFISVFTPCLCDNTPFPSNTNSLKSCNANQKISSDKLKFWFVTYKLLSRRRCGLRVHCRTPDPKVAGSNSVRVMILSWS